MAVTAAFVHFVDSPICCTFFVPQCHAPCCPGCGPSISLPFLFCAYSERVVFRFLLLFSLCFFRRFLSFSGLLFVSALTPHPPHCFQFTYFVFLCFPRDLPVS